MSEQNYWTRLGRRQISRRTMLRASVRAGVGAAGLALVGCDDDDDDDAAVAQAEEQAEQAEPEPEAEEEMEEEEQAEPEAEEEMEEGEQAAAGTRIEDDERPLVIARKMDDLTQLDPHRSFTDTGLIYAAAVYQSLVGVDRADNVTLTPRVATEWSPSADLKTWTFKLNPAAVFADGTPLTSVEVKWSLERMINLKATPSFFLAGVESIEAPATDEIVIHLAAADAAFPAKVSSTQVAILNKALAEANGATGGPDAETTDAAEQWFTTQSAGSGPYVLESFQAGDHARLVRNENYWGPSPKAAIKTVIIQQVASAVAQRQLLEAGEVDIAAQLDPDLARGINNDAVTVELVPSFNIVHIGFVLNTEGAVGSEIDLNHDVRHAIRLAIDYDGMIETLLGGSGRRQASMIPNGFLGTANLPLPERDLDEARRLLAAGGYPDGFEMDVPYWNTNAYGIDFNLMMQKMQVDLAEVGIKLNLKPLESSVLFPDVNSHKVPFIALYYAPDHPDSVQYPAYFAMIDGARWSARVGGLGDAIVSATQQDLYDRALATADPEERGQLYDRLAREMIDDAYLIPVVNPDIVLAYRSDLQGMHYALNGTVQVWHLYRNG